MLEKGRLLADEMRLRRPGLEWTSTVGVRLERGLCSLYCALLALLACLRLSKCPKNLTLRLQSFLMKGLNIVCCCLFQRSRQTGGEELLKDLVNYERSDLTLGVSLIRRWICLLYSRMRRICR